MLTHANYAQSPDGDPVPDLIQGAFCDGLDGCWSDPTTEAGMVWSSIVDEMGVEIV